MNLSLGGGKSAAMDAAVRAMARHNWHIVAAAGNSAKDACDTSPAGASGIVTVAAKDKYQQYASFTNYGKCVAVVAPGVGILSLLPYNQVAYKSGTSMAAPIVAGIWSAMPHLNVSQFLRAVYRYNRVSGNRPYTTSSDIQLPHPNSTC